MPGLTERDWRRALQVQDACNLSGVVHAFHSVVDRIWEEANELGKGTDWVNTHPISMAYADKIRSLSKCDYENNLGNAYNDIVRVIDNWPLTPLLNLT